MNDILEFIKSEEVTIVGMIVLTAAILALIVFLIEKTYYKLKQKRNNLLIDKIVEEESNLNTVSDNIEKTPIVAIEEEKIETKAPVIPIEEFNQVKSQTQTNSIESIYNEVKEEVEQLQYTDPEPNQEEAKEELRKATEELIKQEQINKESNIGLTKFEAEQEENAIISLDELNQKSKLLYQQNEITQYQDEGNEPISLEDLEERIKSIKENIEELTNDQIEIQPVNKIEQENIEPQKVKLDDIYTIEENRQAYREDHVFKSSPIISPIFGIEEQSTENNMELENTANYDKLDEEIKKTNQFLATIKELQKKLD